MSCSKVDIDASVLSLTQDARSIVAGTLQDTGSSETTPGMHKVRAIMKAITREGKSHLRPLCTSMDVTLALQELFELQMFIKGSVMFPQSLRGPLVKEVAGLYRCVYRRNLPPQYLFLRYYTVTRFSRCLVKTMRQVCSSSTIPTFGTIYLSFTVP
jgi:hypothetical protein